ncbi:MAG: hypothetical protein WC471_01590 [Candidatus Woesearchaeota archaeon]|jgi:hypothetical protein
MKKYLSMDQEFQILLLVLDKVLWLGFGLLALGLYKILSQNLISEGIFYFVISIVILILFIISLVKEYHVGR